MEPESLEHKISKYTYKLKHAKNRDEADTYQQKLKQYHRLRRGGMVGGDPLDTFKKSYTELEGNIQKKIEEIGKISGLDTKAVEAQLIAISKRFDEINIRLATDEKAIVFAKQEVPKLKALVDKIKAGDSKAVDLPIVKEIDDKLTALLAKLSILDKSKAEGPSLFSEIRKVDEEQRKELPVPPKGATAGPMGATAGPSKPPGAGETAGPMGATAGPSKGPSKPPGAGETAGPSKGPSNPPGAGETAGPSASPSKPPGAGETAGPSKGPSKPPGAGETAGPSAGPSKPPGAGETAGPSKGPSKPPGAGETAGPSKGPSKPPGAGETAGPSKGPSKPPGTEEATGAPVPPVAPPVKERGDVKKVEVAVNIPEVTPLAPESDKEFLGKVLGSINDAGKDALKFYTENPKNVGFIKRYPDTKIPEKITEFEEKIVSFINEINRGIDKKVSQDKLLAAIESVKDKLGGVNPKVSPVCWDMCKARIDEIKAKNPTVAKALEDQLGPISEIITKEPVIPKKDKTIGTGEQKIEEGEKLLENIHKKK